MPASVRPISLDVSIMKQKQTRKKITKIFRRQYWFWSLIGVVSLGIAFVPIPSTFSQPVEKTLRVEASTFEFTPAVLSVNRGDLVSIELNSKDVVHGLYLDGYDIQITAQPGQIAILKFVADTRGTFRFRCSVSCGALHPFMIGKLKVGPDLLLMRGVGMMVLAVLTGVWSSRLWSAIT